MSPHPFIEVKRSLAVSAATQANPIVVTTAVNHRLTNRDRVRIEDALPSLLELLVNDSKINVLSATTFELVGVDGSAGDAYTGAAAVTILTNLAPQAYPAVENIDGQVFNLHPNTDRDTTVLQVEASEDPTGANQGVDLILEGRADPSAPWIQIANVGNTGWTASGAVWTQVVAGLPRMAQMRFRLASVAGSTNTVQAWLQE